jgi:DNA repair protein RecO (recombination protein O)
VDPVKTLTTDAFVLRRTDYGESHRMVMLATREAGVLSAVARHARRSTRRFGGALELFTLIGAELERRTEDGPWALANTRILRYHEGYARDVGRLAAGSYAVELFRLLVPREVGEEEAFSWLDGFLARWESELPGPVEMAVEELALLSVLGHAPRFDRCVSCGREAPEKSWARFDHAAGGIVCAGCGGEGLRLGSRMRAFLIAAGAGGAADATPAGSIAGEEAVLRRCLDLYVRAVADREPRSMPALRRAWGMD